MMWDENVITDVGVSDEGLFNCKLGCFTVVVAAYKKGWLDIARVNGFSMYLFPR